MRTFDQFNPEPPRLERIRTSAVLVVAADRRVRAAIAGACDTYGIPVRSAASIAEVEQWPVRQAVVADDAHLTPLWLNVGATRVIALVDHPDDGAAALARGATDWLWRGRFGALHLLDVLGESARVSPPRPPA